MTHDDASDDVNKQKEDVSQSLTDHINASIDAAMEGLPDHITASVSSAMDHLPDHINAALEALPEHMAAMREGMVGLGGWNDEDADGNGLIEQQFSVGDHPELSVRNHGGDISVRAEDGQTIKVRARSGSSRSAREAVRLSHEGDRVSVHSEGGRSVVYEITVPRSCRVRINTVGGDVSLQGTRSSVFVESVSGDTTLSDLAGDCTVTSANGDIHARALSGVAVLNTASGDVEIRSSQLQQFRLNSASGDITVETPLAPDGQYVSHTASGDPNLLLPEGTAATVRMHTTSGEITCDLPAEIIRHNGSNWECRVNGGGVEVHLHTTSGDVRVARAGEATADSVRPPEPVQQPAPPVPPAPPSPAPAVPPVDPAPAASAPEPAARAEENGDETVAILKALERGELSVDDAMKRLDDLP